jgi:hypothetical protein
MKTLITLFLLFLMYSVKGQVITPPPFIISGGDIRIGTLYRDTVQIKIIIAATDTTIKTIYGIGIRNTFHSATKVTQNCWIKEQILDKSFHPIVGEIIKLIYLQEYPDHSSTAPIWSYL